MGIKFKLSSLASLLLISIGTAQVDISGTGVNTITSDIAVGKNVGIGSLILESPSLTGNYNNAFGYATLRNNEKGSVNNAFGSFALYSNTDGKNNNAFGRSALSDNTKGNNNNGFGHGVLRLNTLGSENIAFGTFSLYSNKKGNRNIGIGYKAAYSNVDSSDNIAIGSEALRTNFAGSNNVAIGNQAGKSSVGHTNVYIGNQAGYSETGSNKLHIANNSTESLIYGEFDNKILKLNGKVGIGANFGSNFLATAAGVDVSDYNLFVKGGILTGELRLIAYNWADYVFKPSYKLMKLSDVEAYIVDKGHLPNTPSATEIEAKGLSVSVMTTLQQEKIEELTLYTIEQDKQLSKQQKELTRQAKEIEALKIMVQSLINK